MWKNQLIGQQGHILHTRRNGCISCQIWGACSKGYNGEI
jgi:hypothetical protein